MDHQHITSHTDNYRIHNTLFQKNGAVITSFGCKSVQ